MRAGSYLIVENLDRLTRENPIQAIPFVLSLISAGIRVVQLAPFEVVYDAEMDQGKLMTMLWELSRGHGESRRKSDMVGQAWAEKRRAAREGVPHGARCPAWIELVGGKYRLKPQAAKAVRKIYAWCIEGLGLTSIVRRLNAEGIEPITGDRWVRSYVGRVLLSRETIGEFQPCKGTRRSTVPDGEPIPRYFPAVVSLALWSQAQSSRAARTGRSGRPGRHGGPTSPFAGLLWAAVDGSKLHAERNGRHARFVSAKTIEGTADARVGYFPVDDLVGGLISQLQELAAADLFENPTAAEIQTLEGQIGDVERRLKAALAQFEDDPESPVWASQVSKYDREQRALAAELQEARQRFANPVPAAWAEALDLMRRENPTRLRQTLLVTVEGVWCVFVRRGHGVKVAAAQVFFVGGQCRDYLILSERPQGRNARKKTGRYVCFSRKEAIPGEFDLRNPEHAKAMADALADVDLARFDRK